jgi:hypothetical protein
MKVDWGRATAGIRAKEIEVQPCRRRRGIEDGLDHDADLEHPLNEPDEIAAPVLQRVVRQARPVHRQQDEKAVLITVDAREHEFRSGGDAVFIPSPFERPLAHASVIEVQTIDRQIESLTR